jgi:hypothetical protein
MALRKRQKKSLNHTKRSAAKRQKQEIEYFVEAIRDHRINVDDNEIEFLIKWRDYPEHENSWQNFHFFSEDQPKMVEQYLLKLFNNNGQLVSYLTIFSSIRMLIKCKMLKNTRRGQFLRNGSQSLTPRALTTMKFRAIISFKKRPTNWRKALQLTSLLNCKFQNFYFIM